jgi:hypothetical protein
MIVCSYEDRPTDLVGLKLLVSSLRRHVPGVAVYICCPNAPPAFQRWIAARPGVQLDQTVHPTLKGWNVKPALLLRLLDAGHDDVIWMDSDLIVAGDFRGLIEDDQSLVLTNEIAWNPRKESLLRTRSWNLPPARTVPPIVNSAFIRVTPSYRPLIAEWARLMTTPEYQAVQRLPIGERPTHMLGDQDVLTALLGSAEFSDLRVRFLRRGREIIHDTEGGYPPLDRLANLMGPMPPLVHAQAYKPWRFPTPPAPLDAPGRYYHFLHVETSPYSYLAREYRDELDEPTPYLDMHSLYGKAADAVARGNPHMSGFAQAVMSRVIARGHWVRDQYGRARRAVLRVASRPPG